MAISPDDDLGDDVRRYLELALSAPDAELIRRYFEECAGRTGSSSEPLSAAERRWVETNLEVNPTWQQAWRRLEAAHGQSVDWPGASGPAGPLSVVFLLGMLLL